MYPKGINAGTANGSFKHGLWKHPLYRVWLSMKTRCLNPNYSRYHYYGGRGIRICERWLDVKVFIEDMLPSWQEGLQLDRIDVNGNYEPSNCRWATRSQNTKNTRRRAKLQSDIDNVTYHGGRWTFRKSFGSKEEAEQFAKMHGCL